MTDQVSGQYSLLVALRQAVDGVRHRGQRVMFDMHADNVREWEELLAIEQERDALRAAKSCSIHGDPLVCLACEADEDNIWQRTVHRVTPPRLRGEPDHPADRLRQQALSISETLRHAGIGPCTLPEGVRAVVAERDALRTERDEQFGATILERKRAERAESELTTLRTQHQALLDRLAGLEREWRVAWPRFPTAVASRHAVRENCADQLATVRKEQG